MARLPLRLATGLLILNSRLYSIASSFVLPSAQTSLSSTATKAGASPLNSKVCRSSSTSFSLFDSIGQSRLFSSSSATSEDMAVTKEQVQGSLAAASKAHHDYEVNFLAGVRDEQWAGIYAAYTLGQLGDFTTPTALTKWLQEAKGDGEWADYTAAYVVMKLANDK